MVEERERGRKGELKGHSLTEEEYEGGRVDTREGVGEGTEIVLDLNVKEEVEST